MSRRLLSITSSLLFVAGAIVVTAAPAAAYQCNQGWRDASDGTAYLTGDGVNYRNGPSTSCGSNGQWAIDIPFFYLHCWTEGQPVTRNGVTNNRWWHMRRAGTQQQGWVSRAYLYPDVVQVDSNKC